MKLFDEIPNIETEHLILRKITSGDLSVIQRLSKDEAVRKYLPAFLAEEQSPTPEMALKKFYGEMFEKRESLFLGICCKAEPKKMAGIGEYYGYDALKKEVSIGCRLLPEYWGMGIGREAIASLMDYAIEVCGILCIHSEILPQNTASCRIAESLGYRLARANVKEDWDLPEDVFVNEYEYRVKVDKERICV